MLDILGVDIEPGDIVVYTGAGAGRNLPPLCLGEVVSNTKHSVKLYKLNRDLSRTQQRAGYIVELDEPAFPGSTYNKTKFIETGLEDEPPVSIRNYIGRFYVIRKATP